MPAADGKMRLTDVATMKQLLHIIQSISSPKAEPVKQWLAQVGSERLDEMADPEIAIQRAMDYYRKTAGVCVTGDLEKEDCKINRLFF